MERKKREKHFNCFWTHICRDTLECCHFCKRKDCEWRCLDDHINCKYKDIEVNVVEEEPTKGKEEVKEIVKVKSNVVKTKPNVAKMWGG